MNERRELIERAAGPLPPFIEELRMKIRASEKTQTRRVMKPQPHQDENRHWFLGNSMEGFRGVVPDYMLHHCKYGQAGQVRYLREPLVRDERGFARYENDQTLVLDVDGDVVVWRWKRERLPQIFMPKVLARTFVRLESTRGERLWAINDADALAEGIDRDGLNAAILLAVAKGLKGGSLAVDRYARLWNSINADRGYAWAGNWWVWVLDWKMIGGENGA